MTAPLTNGIKSENGSNLGKGSNNGDDDERIGAAGHFNILMTKREKPIDVAAEGTIGNPLLPQVKADPEHPSPHSIRSKENGHEDKHEDVKPTIGKIGNSLGSASSSSRNSSPSLSRSDNDSAENVHSDAESASGSIASSSKSALSASSSPSPSSSPRKRRSAHADGNGLTAVVTSLPASEHKRRTKKASNAAYGAPPQIIDHLPRAEEEALATFTVLGENAYANKHIGRSQGHEWGLVCECNYRPGRDEITSACSEEANCINRLTQVECMVADCRCGISCQNQRFQKKQYADVEVIQTEKKGFGLRAGSDIPAEGFIYEYIGEVVEEEDFQKRMKRYHDERIPHFYFMMLQRDEYLDATKRGGIARFINHSCNPNCYVAKWHVGKHYRMGIFSQREILKGEELTFNYNVDRYGNEAQPCYCGEPNCVGQLGGKTQTDIGGMSNLYIEALGIVDVVEQLQARGNKKQKSRILDEDFTPTLHSLEEDEVPTVATAIRQAATNRSILTKLLQRIEMTDDIAVHKRFVRLHGFVLMSGVLTGWQNDSEVLVSSMRILAKWPLIARNKVVDTGVEELVASLRHHEDRQEVASLAKELYDAWQQLNLEFRIARKEEVGGLGAEADAADEDEEAAALIRSRRRREYEEDSHDDIQSRIDHELDRAQAPNDVSDRLRSVVPRPLGVLSTPGGGAGGTPNAIRFRERDRGALAPAWATSTWRPLSSSRQPNTLHHLSGRSTHNSLKDPSTPQTPADERSMPSSLAAATTPPSSFTKPVSIEEIIRRANERDALERTKMEEEEEGQRKKSSSSSTTVTVNLKRSGSSSGKASRETGAASSSSTSKGKSRSSHGEDSQKRRKKHHSHSHSLPRSSSSLGSHLQTTATSFSSSSHQTQGSLERQVEKRLHLIVGETVVGVMSKFKEEVFLKDKETFKRYAKDLTEIICAKEKKNPKFWPPVLSKVEENSAGKRTTAERPAEGEVTAEGVTKTDDQSKSSSWTTSPLPTSTSEGVSIAAAERHLEKLSSRGEKREKIKTFAKEYVSKLVARKKAAALAGTHASRNGVEKGEGVR